MPDNVFNTPGTVTVAFPRSDWYSVNNSTRMNADIRVEAYHLETVADVGIGGGHSGTQLIHSTAIANFTGGADPDNLVELQALAAQIAADWFAWRLASLEIRFESVVPWIMDGMHDVEFLHETPPITTALYRTAWEPDSGVLHHAGQFGSSDEPPICGAQGVKVVDGILLDGKFDGLLQLRDNGTETDGDDVPIWIYDWNGAASLTAGDQFNGTFRGIEPGGATYISIVTANLGNALTDTAAWLPLAGSITPAAWSGATAYVAGNVVSSSGNDYLCILAHTNHAPPNATYWLLVTLTDQRGYSAGGSYGIGDYVRELRPVYSIRSDGGVQSIIAHTAATFTIPAVAGTVAVTITSAVDTSIWMVIGQTIEIDDGTHRVYGWISAIADSIHFTLTLGRVALGTVGNTMAIAAKVIISGDPSPAGGGAGIISINSSTTPNQYIGLTKLGTDISLTSVVASTPAWSSTQAYQVGWFAQKSGNVYRCLLAHTNQTPPNATYWEISGGSGFLSINIPDGGTSVTAGLLTNITQTIAGDKTITGLTTFSGQVQTFNSVLLTGSVFTGGPDVQLGVIASPAGKTSITIIDGTNTEVLLTASYNLGNTSSQATSSFAILGGAGVTTGTGFSGEAGIVIGATTEAGIAAAWSTVAYVAGRSYVTDGGGLYRCITNHTGASINEPGVGANWTQFWQRCSAATGNLSVASMISVMGNDGSYHMNLTGAIAGINFISGFCIGGGLNMTGVSLSGADITGVTGTLPAGSGGTGLTAPGTSGNVLTSNGTAWVSSPPAGGSTLTFADEIPSGTINGSNATFTLAHAPATAAALILFLNGLRQRQGAGKDYTLSGSTITMASAPLSGDSLDANYSY